MQPVSIFDFVEQWNSEGYGIALVDKETDVVIEPYVDPSDYPALMFNSMKNGATSTCGKYYIVFHSGCLENKNYFLDQQYQKKQFERSERIALTQ
jgi:hypothetical protein